MGFKEKLKEILKESLSEEELSLLPRGFQSIGKVMIIKLDQKLLERKELIGKTCLELIPHMKSVYLNLGKIKGKYREPENIELIAGENNPIVEHKEHGVRYRFDLTKIMFSKGNINERKLLAKMVKDGEIIVDMFAGIGYFSLPIAKNSNPDRIYSIELNPVSYEFLVENIKLNHLEEIIIPILGDCNEEVLSLSKKGIKADRIIMGVFPAPKNFIKNALTLTKDDGSVYHYEGVVDKEKVMDLFDEFNQVAEENKYSCKLISHRLVKSYGPNLYHIVLDIRVTEKK